MGNRLTCERGGGRRGGGGGVGCGSLAYPKKHQGQLELDVSRAMA